MTILHPGWSPRPGGGYERSCGLIAVICWRVKWSVVNPVHLGPEIFPGRTNPSKFGTPEAAMRAANAAWPLEPDAEPEEPVTKKWRAEPETTDPFSGEPGR